MLKAMLIDDEILALKELQLQLKDIGNIDVVGAFTNPYEGFFNIKQLTPDIIFLDIDMPQTSGVYLAEQIVNTYDNISIVFVTAYDQYAINAFDLHALDYILKPVSPERLVKSISWFEKEKRHTSRDQINSLSEKYEESIKKFLVTNGENIVLLDLDDICYIEALNKETKIRTLDNQYISKYPLNYYESKLKNVNFYRAHRSYIINLEKVTKITPKINYSFDIYFKGIPDYVPISRSNVKNLRQLLEL